MRRRWLTLLLIIAAALPGLAGTLVQFRTPLGDLPVELYDEEKPVTVRNFIRLVRAGAYTNTLFHRCVPGFVLQGGGYGTSYRTSTNIFNSVYYVPSFGPITNEFGVGRTLSNTFGTIAMAKSAGLPDSATCQWFFNLADNSANLNNQNGGFTVFGRLLGPTNLLHSFNGRWYTNGLYNAGGDFATLPVLYNGDGDPRYVDLLFIDISLLQVAVNSTTGGGFTISWQSTTGLTQVVEYTDGFPPAWQELCRTNGNGQRLQAGDGAEVPGRFYRVLVEEP